VLIFRLGTERLLEGIADGKSHQVPIGYGEIERGIHQVRIRPAGFAVERRIGELRIGRSQPELAHRFGDLRAAVLVNRAAPGAGAGMNHHDDLTVPQAPLLRDKAVFFMNA